LSVGALVLGIVGSQTGAGLGATLIPTVGPFAVVAFRQTVAAIVLMGVARPNFRALGWRAIAPAVGMGLVTIVMNNAVYLSIDRVGVGLAITLEFLGPLTVALLASRRLVDVLCALGAGLGVGLIVLGPARLDPLGVLFGLVGAAAWGFYILLARRAAKRLPGIDGSAIAALTAAVLFVPFGFATLIGRQWGLHVLLFGALAGLLSSAVPTAIDMFVLRRIEARVYGLLMALNPAIAALAGWLVAGEVLSLTQWIALGLISFTSAIALSRRGAEPHIEDEPA
jgi:inner membrane transporter RhtA